MSLNPNITLFDEPREVNSKASEEYVHVRFEYPDVEKFWDGWVPVEYRRTGVSIPASNREGLYRHLNDIYSQMHPFKYEAWSRAQTKYWEATCSVETRRIFNILKDGKWHCRNCEIKNPNFARRIQDLKEMGYTIATDINYVCDVCKNRRSTRLLLLPIDRVQLAGNGYESWSPALRKRIISVLGGIDVYECRESRHVLPDHKFSEIRWDNKTKGVNPETMTDEEIRSKFQLLSNQRNQQKREACRHCFQTGERGVVYGIPFFYQGTSTWDPNIPAKGKAAERGCVGCPWYDIARWRYELLEAMRRTAERATALR